MSVGVSLCEKTRHHPKMRRLQEDTSRGELEVKITKTTCQFENMNQGSHFSWKYESTPGISWNFAIKIIKILEKLHETWKNILLKVKKWLVTVIIISII